MSEWRKKPYIYEINTAVWLNDLSQQHDRTITLEDVPDEVLDHLATFHVDAVWLMGIWQRSEAALVSALNYTHEYQHALPDLVNEDVIGSAYSIGAYEVDDRLGGRESLARLRERLRERDVRLILDYVPNHVAIDHPWITENTHYMVQGTEELMEQGSDLFFKVTVNEEESLFIAHGRDPHFPPWIDTAQVNAFNPEYRAQVRETLLDIASQCDGVRCDMAMLVVNDIFANTWGEYVTEDQPSTEFWEEVIPAVKAEYPNFVFIAEVYWDMEYLLLEQGFDMTYDKRLYDRILDGHIPSIRDHLHAALSYQQRQVRFIENHDEQRAIASLGINKGRAAATLITTLPGAVLLHDGQMTGRNVKLPVQISRQPNETDHSALQDFYQNLLHETARPLYQDGDWRLFQVLQAYPENNTHDGLLAYGWNQQEEFRLIVINLTSMWSNGVINVFGWEGLSGHYWRIYDVLTSVCLYRSGDDLLQNGLRLDLEVYQSHVFRFERLDSSFEVAYVRRAAGH